jgi:hypothetical protein
MQYDFQPPDAFTLPAYLVICNSTVAHLRTGVPITFNGLNVVTPWLMFVAFRKADLPQYTRMNMSLLLT